MQSYKPKPRGRRAISVVEAYYVGNGALCWLQRQRRKGEVGANGEEFNEQRINNMMKLKLILFMHA